jgi:hypothetical protein
MKLLSYLILTAILLSIGAPLASAQEADEDWKQIVPGIDYREYHLSTPNNVFITRMEQNNPQVTIDSSIGLGRLSGGAETVKKMAQRYDGAINYWDETWGNRNQVVAAINGFYFGPPFEPNGVPWSGQASSGWYAKHFTDKESGSGFAWKLDRSAFIGECVSHPVNKQQVYYFREGLIINSDGQSFDGLNVSRDDDEFILYTPQYDTNTGTTGSANSIEVLVQLRNPALIIPYSDMAAADKGKIIDIRDKKGSTTIPFDHVVLSMHGMKRDEFLNLGIMEGDEVGITQKIKNCPISPDNNWDYTYASVGGAFYFLKDDQVQYMPGDPQANVRDPRTAIAFNDDYVFFIVVDGRDEWHSHGMTIGELAEFTKYELGATYGIAEDGGGSSTMVVDGEVKNNTYCNITICKGQIYLPFVTAGGTKKQSEQSPSPPLLMPRLPQSSEPQPERLSGDGLPLTEEYYAFTQETAGSQLQRLVANGMMMVVVEPKGDPSTTFTVDDNIATQITVNVRLGPGTNYGLVDTVDPGISGIVLGDDNGLNGVWAKGYYWWRVLLEVGDLDIIGWVIEPALTAETP